MSNLMTSALRGFGRTASCLIFGALTLILTACTGTVSPDIKFDSGSPKALVVMGVEGLEYWHGTSFGLSFRGVDASGKMDNRSFYVSNGDGWVARNPTEYYVMEVEPGAYIVDMALTDTGFQRTYARYCEGTLKFGALAGKAIYVGNFAAPPGPGAAHLVRPQFEAAAAKLREYSQISPALEQADIRPVPYPKKEYCD